MRKRFIIVIMIIKLSKKTWIGTYFCKSGLKQCSHAHMYMETIIHHLSCSSSKYWVQRDPFIKRFQCRCWRQQSAFCAKMTSKVQLKITDFNTFSWCFSSNK